MILAVIIPAYNEAQSLGKVINSCLSFLPQNRLVVVNDGSTDNTLQIAKKYKVNVINLPLNSGIGGAVQTGLKYALRHNFDYVVQVDADGQHNPQDIHQLVSHQKKTSADVVIGSRYIKKTPYHTSLNRRIGIKLFSWVINILTGHKITDPTSGFRLYNRSAVEFLAQIYPTEFPEPESLLLLLKHKFRVEEVSVSMNQRSHGNSSFSAVKGIYFFVLNLISIIAKSPLPFRKYPYA